MSEEKKYRGLRHAITVLAYWMRQEEKVTHADYLTILHINQVSNESLEAVCQLDYGMSAEQLQTEVEQKVMELRTVRWNPAEKRED